MGKRKSVSKTKERKLLFLKECFKIEVECYVENSSNKSSNKPLYIFFIKKSNWRERWKNKQTREEREKAKSKGSERQQRHVKKGTERERDNKVKRERGRERKGRLCHVLESNERTTKYFHRQVQHLFYFELCQINVAMD